MEKELISINNCKIKKGFTDILPSLTWTMKEKEAWLVIGPNGGGKVDFINALSGVFDFFAENESSFYKSDFKNSTSLVSLEVAAKLIEEERNRDESEYMDKIDIGRTARVYICEVLKNNDIKLNIENLPEVKLCGIEKILDRGLKFMSTGEIRRTILCRALLSGAKLLILSNPFTGLDAQSRKILLDFFNTVFENQLKSTASEFPRIILCMDRFQEIPDSISHVLEFKDKKISFCGTRNDFEIQLKKNKEAKEELQQKEKQEFLLELQKIQEDSKAIIEQKQQQEILIKFEDVNVGWDDHKVLVHLNWEVKRGEHFLVRGPNGSGKTTIMELITGDNMQVFREKIYLFGARRGSGETIWDIKKQLGIVSYRLHIEYRMVGGTDLLSVIISGFRDSIGLYEKATDTEISLAKAWLKLAGFIGREKETFNSLSYGEQRAILILRAAVKSPQVLILDEPCHGLDENYREKILHLLEIIAETGTTTLLHVTHDPTEVLPCEKNILELHPGETPMYKIISQ